MYINRIVVVDVAHLHSGEDAAASCLVYINVIYRDLYDNVIGELRFPVPIAT